MKVIYLSLLIHFEKQTISFKCFFKLINKGDEIGEKASKTSDNTPDYEFNVWTKHDCQGTEYQNTNRTWFYFGIKTPTQGSLVKLNILNLNRQSKMFSQGMCPVFKVIPGHPNWERIRDKPSYNVII